MRLYARCLPEYFDLLDFKLHEFRQFESITIENTETHETRVFEVADVRELRPEHLNLVKGRYSKVPWDPKLPIFAIELGKEIIVEKAPEVKAESGSRDDDEGKYEYFNQRRKDHGC